MARQSNPSERAKAARLGGRTRPGGWTKSKREAFLETLAQTANVAEKCRAVGMSDTGAYRLRRADAAFRAEWERALGEGIARLKVQYLERGLLGETQVRTALADVEPREAVDLLNRYQPKVLELLLRVHTTADARAEDDDPDGEEARASVEAKLAKLRAHLERKRLAGASVDGA